MPKNKVPLDRNLASALQNQNRKTMRDIEYRYSNLVRMKVISRINTFLQMASYSGSNNKKYNVKKIGSIFYGTLKRRHCCAQLIQLIDGGGRHKQVNSKHYLKQVEQKQK